MDYQNSKIYKILNTIDDEVYVGSTTQPLSKRMATHRRAIDHKRFSKYKIYQKFKELGVDNFYIELIELFPCGCKDELRAKEGHWIRQIGTLNQVVAGRTYKEWYDDNKNKILQYHQNYYNENKHTILEKQKEYNMENKENKRNQNKERYQTNKDVLKQKSRNYYEECKEDIKEKLKQDRFECQCGASIRRSNILRHEQTKKHKNFQAMFVEDEEVEDK